MPCITIKKKSPQFPRLAHQRIHNVHETTTTKPSAHLLLQMARSRRTIYALNKTLAVPESRILELVNETTLHTPSSFNPQLVFGGRAAVAGDKTFKPLDDRVKVYGVAS